MGKLIRILLVEDNADDETLTLRALKNIGDHILVEVARDGEEAVRRLADDEQAVPNLVLLDLHLPKISGLEVLKRIREDERIAQILVVVLTSSDEPDDVRACYREHSNSYIHKPVSFEEFSEVVQRLGVYWLQTNVDLF